MLSFRKKILIGYFSVFLIFFVILFPFASRSVKQITFNAMRSRADSLIEIIQTSPNEEAMIRKLKDLKHLVFFRVTMINSNRQVIYDTHVTKALMTDLNPYYEVDNPEVAEAFARGVGHSERYSQLMEQHFFYMARAYSFHGETHILRTAIPSEYMTDLTRDIELNFLTLVVGMLILFSLMTFVIIHYFSRPIQQIIDVIKPYQEGSEKTIPKIVLEATSPNDDFGRLAETLNSLSARVESQIHSLTLERNEKEAVLESLVEGVIAVDSDLKIIYANRRASDIMHMEREELIGKPFHHPELKFCRELLRQCQSENAVLAEERQLTGKLNLYLAVIASPTGEGTGAILVLHDKSIQHRMLEMRKAFIANASHELKTPITIIRGFAETLHDHPDLPKETMMGITEKITRNCVRMTNLVRDLLTLADIENLPQSRLDHCNLDAIIEKCEQHVHGVYPDAKITKVNNTGRPVKVDGDPELLELAITNLLSNAARYSDPPANIVVTIDRDDEFVTIEVKDQGIGIPKEDQAHIFERFYRVDKARSRKLGGTGLGLSIVKTIIEKHNGLVMLKSEVGVGSIFTIRLPVQNFGSP
jgi:two-component system phosphate regulon sensor histidine kinase PhoR